MAKLDLMPQAAVTEASFLEILDTVTGDTVLVNTMHIIAGTIESGAPDEVRLHVNATIPGQGNQTQNFWVDLTGEDAAVVLRFLRAKSRGNVQGSFSV